jgi:hypothetical protein
MAAWAMHARSQDPREQGSHADAWVRRIHPTAREVGHRSAMARSPMARSPT